TVLAGLRARFPNAQITYVQGSGLINPALTPVPDEALCVDDHCRTHGLTATRFADGTLSGAPISTRVEPNARQAWQGEQRIGATRWSGFITAPESGEYHFRYQTDGGGGFRVWVNNTAVVDSWRPSFRPSIVTGAITLEAGHVYPIRVETFSRRDQADE